MRLLPKILTVLVVGITLGVLSAWLSVAPGLPRGIENGPWQTSLVTGSAQSGPYWRAAVALHGLFALNSSETVYFVAETDRDGNPLDGACRYEVAGHDPDARWWSITAYGADEYLIPNPAHRFSAAKDAIRRDGNGAFSIEVAGAERIGTATGENWIPVRPGRFSLMLRLYNPGPGVLDHPAHTVLPSVRRGSCS
jgi:hypothetical protein